MGRMSCRKCGRKPPVLYNIPINPEGQTFFERGLRFICKECRDAAM